MKILLSLFVFFSGQLFAELLPPKEHFVWLSENVEKTDYSAKIRLVSTEVYDSNELYTMYYETYELIESVKGKLPSTLKFKNFSETEHYNRIKYNSIYIGSFCFDGEYYYYPDIGYRFAFHEAFNEIVEKHKSIKAKINKCSQQEQ